MLFRADDDSGRSVALFNHRRMLNQLRRFRPALIIVGLVGTVVLAGWVLFFSSMLATDDVAVAGNKGVSTKQIAAAADVPIGTPLIRVNLDDIRARVAAIPEIASVTVHRDWPNTVSISVHERTPVATLRRDSAWWAVDADGVLFERSRARDTTLPVIDVPKSGGTDALVEATSVIAALPPALLDQAKRLTAETMDSITLRMKDHSEVVWGSAAESDRKVEVLAALLKKIDAKVYDVSVPEEPTTSNRASN